MIHVFLVVHNAAQTFILTSYFSRLFLIVLALSTQHLAWCFKLQKPDQKLIINQDADNSYHVSKMPYFFFETGWPLITSLHELITMICYREKQTPTRLHSAFDIETIGSKCHGNIHTRPRLSTSGMVNISNGTWLEDDGKTLKSSVKRSIHAGGIIIPTKTATSNCLLCMVGLGIDEW